MNDCVVESFDVLCIFVIIIVIVVVIVVVVVITTTSTSTTITTTTRMIMMIIIMIVVMILMMIIMLMIIIMMIMIMLIMMIMMMMLIIINIILILVIVLIMITITMMIIFIGITIVIVIRSSFIVTITTTTTTITHHGSRCDFCCYTWEVRTPRKSSQSRRKLARKFQGNLQKAASSRESCQQVASVVPFSHFEVASSGRKAGKSFCKYASCLFQLPAAWHPRENSAKVASKLAKGWQPAAKDVRGINVFPAFP